MNYANLLAIRVGQIIDYYDQVFCVHADNSTLPNFGEVNLRKIMAPKTTKWKQERLLFSFVSF